MNTPSEDLLESSEFTSFLFNNVSSAIFLVGKDTKIKKVNNSWQTIFSRNEIDVIEQLCGNALGCAFATEAGVDCGTTAECKDCEIRKNITHGFEDTQTVQTCYISRNFYIDKVPVQKYLRMKTRHVTFNGEEMQIVAIDDITELEEQKQKVIEMSNKDFLTNLYNRRYFFEVGESIFQNAKRGNISISVAMFDIDLFKLVNDTYGHAAGDFILKSVSDILTKNLRKADILSRFGGEEFCLILMYKEADEIYSVVDKLRLFVELEEFLFENKKLKVTISAGFTSLLENSLEEMVNRADEMLYRAKKSGRNRTEEYTLPAKTD